MLASRPRMPIIAKEAFMFHKLHTQNHSQSRNKSGLFRIIALGVGVVNSFNMKNGVNVIKRQYVKHILCRMMIKNA